MKKHPTVTILVSNILAYIRYFTSFLLFLHRDIEEYLISATFVQAIETAEQASGQRRWYAAR